MNEIYNIYIYSRIDSSRLLILNLSLHYKFDCAKLWE